jgi:hypothetical protein
MPSQCRHLRTNGTQCRAHRLWKEDYCFFHLHHRTPHGTPRRGEEAPAPPPASGIEIPLLEDLSAIQITLGRVLTALAQGKINATEARAYIAGLRLAAANVRHKDFAPAHSVEAYIQYDNGDAIGPEQYVSEQKPQHPLMESALLTQRHLAERVLYEATLDAYLTQGQTPPDTLRPPVPGPPDPNKTTPEEIQQWLKTGWKAAQTRARAIEEARKNIPEPIPTPIPPRHAYNIHNQSHQSA